MNLNECEYEAAVEPQLGLIKSMVPSIIKTFQATKDVRSIFPSLDAMENIIDYLRSLAPEEPDIEPEDDDDFPFSMDWNDDTNKVTVKRIGQYLYNIDIENINATPGVPEEIFGAIPNATYMTLYFPVTCGKSFTVRQENPMLSHYEGDSDIHCANEVWYKEKTYCLDDSDEFDYSFLMGPGRSYIKITFDNSIVIDINAHFHFKDSEE